MRQPSTSAIERALRQIHDADRTADQLSAAERAASRITEAQRVVEPDLYRSTYKDALETTSAIKRANDALTADSRYAAPDLYQAYSDPIETMGSIRHAQEHLERVRRLAEPVPHARLFLEAESPVAAATRQLLKDARRAGETYEETELEILKRTAEAAGLSPRGAHAYAQDELRRRHSTHAYGGLVPLHVPHRLRDMDSLSPPPRVNPVGSYAIATRVSPTASRSESGERSFAYDLQEARPAVPRRVRRRREVAPQPREHDPAVVESVTELGERLRHRRIEMGLSQQEFADMAGVGRRFLSELESGKESVELGRVLRVCRAAGLQLLTG